jgi:hypothetical protein
MSFRSSYWYRAAVLVSFGVALSGCTLLRSAAGVTKSSPDEFAVLTKGSLVIPPDFGLMPPKPGAAPTNQSDPVSSAQGALFGADATAAAAALPGDASMSEKVLLTNAGAGAADPQIRQLIAADNSALLAADDSFVGDILFWQDKKKTDQGKPVDADAEAKRLSGQKAGQPVEEPKDTKDGGGWFDWF